MVHLTFLEKATGQDLILGMLHALLLREKCCGDDQRQLSFGDTQAVIASMYSKASKQLPMLLSAMHEEGWKTDTGVTSIEPGSACRLAVLNK